jgi:predicted lipoprotein with Yx(FWY)xxD motif
MIYFQVSNLEILLMSQLQIVIQQTKENTNSTYPTAYENSLAYKFHQIAAQWVRPVEKVYHRQGVLITPYNISPASHVSVLWKCDKLATSECDDKCAHYWNTKVENRTHNRGCPWEVVVRTQTKYVYIYQ